MEVIIGTDYDDISRRAAAVVAALVRVKPEAVLGLATGSSPLGIYRELIRLHRDEGLDFSRVTTFNLDEYVGLSDDHPQSYHQFMSEHLFRHVNLCADNTFIPSGKASDFHEHASWYERQIVERGGIDLQLLGIGSDGHIGFNEPGSSLGSRTRLKTLARQTIDDNARFFESPDDVPLFSVTMGVGTILEAKHIVLVASDARKAAAVAGAIEGPVTTMNTASALQLHPDVTCYLDPSAASALRMRDYYEWIQSKKPFAPQ